MHCSSPAEAAELPHHTTPPPAGAEVAFFKVQARAELRENLLLILRTGGGRARTYSRTSFISNVQLREMPAEPSVVSIQFFMLRATW